MELSEQIAELRKLVIEALAEAKAARILAEKTLGLVPNSQLPYPEPWRPVEDSHPVSNTAAFIREVDVTPKPTLASFGGGVAIGRVPTPGTGILAGDAEQDLEAEMWDETMTDDGGEL